MSQEFFSVFHVRIGNRCITWNVNLFQNYLRQNLFDCGYSYKDAEHHLFECTCYVYQRRLFEATRFSITDNYIILFGNELHTDEENECSFTEVETFIKHTEKCTHY